MVFVDEPLFVLVLVAAVLPPILPAVFADEADETADDTE